MDENTSMNLFDYLLEHAEADKTAIIQEGQPTTYRELESMADAVAGMLLQAGMTSRQKVGIIAENSPFWVAAYLGILKAGATAAPLPSRLTIEELGRYIGVIGCRAFCIDNFLLKKYTSCLPAGSLLVPKNDILQCRSDVGNRESMHAVPVAPQRDIASLMFTSGSTGQPNAVMVTHRNIQANTDSIVSYLGLNSSDRMMAILPFHYCYGTSLLHTHLRVGGSLVLNNYFQYVEDMLNEMETWECSGFAGVPSTYQTLLNNRSFRSRSFRALRHLQQAGGKLPDKYISELRAVLPERIRIHIGYGQTEATARLSALPPEKIVEKTGSIGRGIPGVTIEIVDSEGKAVMPGQIGEIVASGKNVTAGYLLPDEAGNPFREGRLHTGDLAYADEDGFIYIVGREKDFIKPSGYKVMTATIEQVLLEIPEIAEAAVVGVPHDQLGEAAKAFVVLKENASCSAESILDHCRTKLPAYAVPCCVEYMTEFPKNPAGKVSKKILKRE
jgi:acyl-CoA synthetase (AMP-forming)/AMP-acid ligase II